MVPKTEPEVGVGVEVGGGAVTTSGTEFMITVGAAKIWHGNNKKNTSNKINTIIV